MPLCNVLEGNPNHVQKHSVNSHRALRPSLWVDLPALLTLQGAADLGLSDSATCSATVQASAP